MSFMKERKQKWKDEWLFSFEMEMAFHSKEKFFGDLNDPKVDEIFKSKKLTLQR